MEDGDSSLKEFLPTSFGFGLVGFEELLVLGRLTDDDDDDFSFKPR